MNDDIVRPAYQKTATLAPQPAAPPRQAPQIHKSQFKAAPKAKRRRLLPARLEMPLLILLGLTGGLLARNSTLGLILVAAYGIAAVILKLPSRTSFVLATMSLGAVSMLLLINPDRELAGNFATYTFVLLIIGVISLALESRLPKSSRRKPRYR